MKLIVFSLSSALIMIGAGRAQQTEVQVQNEQIKVEVTKDSECCAALPLDEKDSKMPSPKRPCILLAITNNSSVPITAWVATTERENSGESHRLSSIGVRSEDNAVFGEDPRMNPT